MTCNECLETTKDVIAKKLLAINLIGAQIGQHKHQLAESNPAPPIIAGTLKSGEQVIVIQYHLQELK